MENLEFKTLVIDQDQKICKINDEEISLSKKEYELLVFFLNNPNKVFSREELLALWNEQATTRAIDTMISRLRTKLGDYGKYIVTRVGFGYSFNKN